MDQILGGFSQGVICYIDDIVIYANALPELLRLMRLVLGTLQEEGLYMKLSKVKLLQSEVLMLGHQVGMKGIQPDPRKVQGLRDAKPP